MRSQSSASAYRDLPALEDIPANEVDDNDRIIHLDIGPNFVPLPFQELPFHESDLDDDEDDGWFSESELSTVDTNDSYTLRFFNREDRNIVDEEYEMPEEAHVFLHKVGYPHYRGVVP